MSRNKRTTCLAILRIVATVSMILLSLAAVACADTVCILDGDAASLEARLSLIGSARCTIDAAYFAFDDDQVGGCVAQALIEAAQRGVKVRLLIDGYNNLLSKSMQSELI